MTIESHKAAMSAPIQREAMHRPACSGGSCRQGRARCETPLACGTPIDDDDEMSPAAKAIVIFIFCGFAVFAFLAAVLPLIF
jgi:hypothetical protein